MLIRTEHNRRFQFAERSSALCGFPLFSCDVMRHVNRQKLLEERSARMKYASSDCVKCASVAQYPPPPPPRGELALGKVRFCTVVLAVFHKHRGIPDFVTHNTRTTMGECRCSLCAFSLHERSQMYCVLSAKNPNTCPNTLFYLTGFNRIAIHFPCGGSVLATGHMPYIVGLGTSSQDAGTSRRVWDG